MNEEITTLATRPLPTHGQPIILIGDRAFALSELPQPRQTRYDNGSKELLFVVGMGLGGIVVGFLIFKAFSPSSPSGPVVIQQAQPEKRPYYRRDCRPAGMFGWGSECSEERGWQ